MNFVTVSSDIFRISKCTSAGLNKLLVDKLGSKSVHRNLRNVNKMLSPQRLSV